MVMDGGIDHIRADVDAEFADDKNAEAIAENGEGDDDQNHHGATPGGFQEHVASQEAGHEQDHGRVNAAAFGGDAQRHAGQLEIEAIDENGGADGFDHGDGGPGGSVL